MALICMNESRITRCHCTHDMVLLLLSEAPTFLHPVQTIFARSCALLCACVGNRRTAVSTERPLFWRLRYPSHNLCALEGPGFAGLSRIPSPPSCTPFRTFVSCFPHFQSWRKLARRVPACTYAPLLLHSAGACCASKWWLCLAPRKKGWRLCIRLKEFFAFRRLPT